MPCRDWSVEESHTEKLKKERNMLRASMCAVLTALEGDDATFAAVLKKIDWKEAGVTKRELLMWWEEHKESDKIRREREAKIKREREIRASALSKLTDEEKKILGVK